MTSWRDAARPRQKEVGKPQDSAANINPASQYGCLEMLQQPKRRNGWFLETARRWHRRRSRSPSRELAARARLSMKSRSRRGGEYLPRPHRATHLDVRMRRPWSLAAPPKPRQAGWFLTSAPGSAVALVLAGSSTIKWAGAVVRTSDSSSPPRERLLALCDWPLIRVVLLMSDKSWSEPC